MEVYEVKPHDNMPDLSNAKNVYTTFLAGTIDNGNSENWQSKYIEDMHQIAREVTYYRKNDTGYNANDDVIIIYNPRRDDWPSTENTDELNYQINWELEHLEIADVIYMNILGDSKSPITLMELGLFAKTGKVKVTCPKEFYRYDNVRIVCERYEIPLRNSKDENWN